MRRKVLAMLLVLVMVCTFAGCGNTGAGNSQQSGGKTEKVETVPDLKIGPNELPADHSLDLTQSYYKRYDGVEFTTAYAASGADLPEDQTIDSNEYTWYWQAVPGSIPKAEWYAEGEEYIKSLNNDIKIREYLTKELYDSWTHT